MKKNNNITIILPVHDLSSQENKDLFKTALSSVENQKVAAEELLIVIPKSEKSNLEDLIQGSKLNIRVVVNSGDTSFQGQMNLGVSKCKTEWFTFLEFDDELSSNWLDLATRYMAKKDNVGAFLPIIVDVDKEGKFLGFTNEVLWANQFSDEMGYMDLETVKTYQNFNIDGMVMKKSLYENLGGLKPSIKLTFGHEFFMRMCYNGVVIMTIPKIGYKHVNQREGSLFASYTSMDAEEMKFWTELAGREYYHTTDRKIVYEKTEA